MSQESGLFELGFVLGHLTGFEAEDDKYIWNYHGVFWNYMVNF